MSRGHSGRKSDAHTRERSWAGRAVSAPGQGCGREGSGALRRPAG